jgi:uncharacterized protein YbjT (DUF2867 family)
MTVTVFGATGLVGSTLIEKLVSDNRVEKIKAVVRKKGIFSHHKVEEVEIDYNNLSNYSEKVKSDIFYSCLGTTIKKAGSQKAQQIIDRDYPIVVSALAKQLGVKKVICVSSVGANAASSNFYLRTKGEMEEGVKRQMLDNALFVRPSMIEGNRKPFRLGEVLILPIMKVANLFLIGALSKYKSISASHIADAIIHATFNATNNVLYYDEMMER